jgi:hypothetical protein
MTNRINFFATKNDMISILSKLEEQLSYEIKYIQCGKKDGSFYRTIKDIPGLGTLQKNHGEISFIIMPADAEVTINEYGQVYQGENKCSLGFDPSGISEDGTGLIHGMFAIMDDNEISFELFKAVKKLMKAECRISRGWHIGKEAEDLYGRLRFICIGLNEPESFDFRIIEQ